MVSRFLDPAHKQLDQRFPLSLTAPFTASMARSEGVSLAELRQLVRSGHLRPLVRGVYVAAHVPDSLELRRDALRLVVPPDAVVTDRTAGWLMGAPMILAPGDHLEVPRVLVFMDKEHARLRNGLSASGQRVLRADEVMEIDGLRVTTPLRTTCDLGRLLHRRQAFAAMTMMLRLGVFTKEELLEFKRRFDRRRGVVQLRALAPRLDARAESPPEAIVLLHWLDVTDVVPQLQIEVERPGHWSYRLDIGVEELHFAIEYDGEEWHDRTDEQRRADDEKRGWMSKERDWQIEVTKRVNLFGPQRDIDAIIDCGLDDARRRSRRGRR